MHVNFSVALLRWKYFGSEDFSKLDRCVSRFLLPCCVLPRNLGMRKRACEYQCCVVASEVIWIGRLSKIWYMRFKIPVALLRRPQKFREEKKGRVKISVALLRRKLFRSEDFPKFGICVSRFLLPCCVASRNYGRKKRTCGNQCCIVASEVF